MNLSEAKIVDLGTHLAAIKSGERASALYLESGPGIGKSSIEFQVAEALCLAVKEPVGMVQEMVASYTGPDSRGFMMPFKNAAGQLDTIFSTPAWYPTQDNMYVFEPQENGTVVVYNPGTWTGPMPRFGKVFLDEFAQADDDVKKPMAEVLLHGRIGTKALPPGWRVTAAGNRTSDRSGVMREMMFVVNRRCLLPIEPHLPTWLEWASNQPQHRRPHYLTMSFARKEPGVVFADKVPDSSDPFCTPRTLCAMDSDLRALRSEDDERYDRMPLDGLSREVCAGWIGQGAAAQFYSHLKYAEQLPDLEDIVRDPARAKLPSDMGAQMVCAFMISHMLDESTVEPLFAYTKRLSKEMQVLTIKSAGSDKMRHLIPLPEYTAWIKANADMLLASGS